MDLSLLKTKEDLSEYVVSSMQKFLKERGSVHSLGKREKYLDRIMALQRYIAFPWRPDQGNALKAFLGGDPKIRFYVINGIFGCGKTTLLLGMLVNSLMSQTLLPQDALFLSFNVCIRNELRQRLKKIGYRRSVHVRTFDSVVYEICKNYEYEGLHLPNFDGKRRFVYQICRDIVLGKEKLVPIRNQPKVIFIDEVQDLERDTLLVFAAFFRNCKVVFAGDVFQSIQREPRESLLWHLLQRKREDTYHAYFKVTPRVPKKILDTLKSSLSSYYPEMGSQISEWTSSNESSHEKIRWERFYSYSQMYTKTKEFCETHPHDQTMVLAFSSAITVKGAMGDVARLRSFFSNLGWEVNMNHKRMEEGGLFLSTANSSKGLERDYVLALLTFPLEKAFINFSDDLVVNLLTVALTRARKKVVVYVPAYEDKYSRALEIFPCCPRPNKKRIRDDSVRLDDFDLSDFLLIEHSSTEVIRQNVVTYDTRTALKKNIKLFDNAPLTDGILAGRPCLPTEEERALVGLVLENLMTSTWLGKWPRPIPFDNLRNHPLYSHCMGKIEKAAKKYSAFVKGNRMGDTLIEGIILYSQLHIAIYDKLFMSLPKYSVDKIKAYWKCLEPHVQGFRPKGDKLKVQVNLRMPWLTGIADAVVIHENGEYSNGDIWELKASSDYEWGDDALSQAAYYALMTGQRRSRIVLVNPFFNAKRSYYFDSQKIQSMRRLVQNDILIWNASCFLAKSKRVPDVEFFPSSSVAFVHAIQDTRDEVSQCAVITLNTPTRPWIRHDIFYKPTHDEGLEEWSSLTKVEKVRRETGEEQTDLIDSVEAVVKDLKKIGVRRVLFSGDAPDIRTILGGEFRLTSYTGCLDLYDATSLLAPPKEEKKFSLDPDDAITQCIVRCVFFSSGRTGFRAV